MAPPAASSLLLILLCALTAGASAATFTITNNCSFILWPAATPVGGGLQLNPGETWTINNVTVGTSGRIWGRTGCTFNNGGGGGGGHCATGDCAGELSCRVPGNNATEADFTITSDRDYYDISLIDGYNLPMDFSCSTGVNLRCREPACPVGFLFPGDDMKVSECNGNSNYQVTFCP